MPQIFEIRNSMDFRPLMTIFKIRSQFFSHLKKKQNSWNLQSNVFLFFVFDVNEPDSGLTVFGRTFENSGSCAINPRFTTLWLNKKFLYFIIVINVPFTIKICVKYKVIYLLFIIFSEKYTSARLRWKFGKAAVLNWPTRPAFARPTPCHRILPKADRTFSDLKKF